MSSPSTDNGVLPPAQPTAPPPTAPGGAPSTNGGNGRDARGRFTVGNRGGPGNPFARQTAALRRALLAVVTPEDLEAIARVLVERARGGDLVALKLLLLYAVGRPTEAVDPDTLDVQEWHLFQQSQATAEQVQGALGGLALEVACPVVRAARGPIADATAAQLAQALKQEPTAPQTEARAGVSAVSGQEVEDAAVDRDTAAEEGPEQEGQAVVKPVAAAACSARSGKLPVAPILPQEGAGREGLTVREADRPLSDEEDPRPLTPPLRRGYHPRTAPAASAS
jgi:hypothetical protein